MASLFGHIAAGYTIKKYLHPTKSGLILFLAMLSAFLPDFDVIGFKFGIAYESFWGHRGFTHSIAFAIIWGLIVCAFFKEKRLIIFLIISLSTVSHPLLDGMTSGGHGVAFFSPFNNGRYFLPWRPIKVSPLGASRFFSEWGWKVIKSEALYIGLPCLILLGLREAAIFGHSNKKSEEHDN